MAGHIGIVGCSFEGAALCYRTVCGEGEELFGPHAHPEVSTHTLPLAEYVRRQDASDLEGVADLLLTSARKLAAIGADFLICPDNTVHAAMPWVVPRSPRPWLHIAEVVADEAVRRGVRQLGLTGTHWLVRSDVYPDKLRERGVGFLRPSDPERDECGRIIIDELVRGIFKPQSVAYFQRVIENLRAGGCDAVVLGCTEIPLIINDANSALPTLDSTRLLARAALRRAHQPSGTSIE
jgi:aspartate racemase